MHVLRTLLLCTLLSFFSSAYALSDTTTPDSAQIQQMLDALPARGLSDADLKRAQKELEQAQENAQKTLQQDEELTALNQRLNDAPELIKKAQQQLAQLQQSHPKQNLKALAALPLAELETKQAEQSAQLSTLKMELASAGNQILQAQTRPERAQTEISNNQARIQDLGNQLKAGRDNFRQILSEQARTRLQTEQTLLDRLNDLQRTALTGNGQLLDLANAEHELISARINLLENDSQALERLIIERRQQDSERTVSDLSQSMELGNTQQWIYAQSAHNLELSNQLLDFTEQYNRYSQQNLKTQRQLDALGQIEHTLNDQMSVLDGNLLLRKVLNQQKAALPVVTIDPSLNDQIADIRLLQFDLTQEREQLATPEQYIKQQLAAHPEPLSESDQQALEQIINARIELLDRLHPQINSLLSTAINLQLNQTQLKSRSEALRATLDENLFWIPSSRPLDLDWLRAAPGAISEQFANLPWKNGLLELKDGLTSRPHIFIPVLLLFGMLLYKRKTLSGYVDKLNSEVGQLKLDTQLHTPNAMLTNILLALPMSLLLALAGYALMLDARGQNAHFGSALWEMAKAWLIFDIAYRMLADGGVAQRHFHWPARQTNFLHRYMLLLAVVVMALVAVVAIAGSRVIGYSSDVLGTLVVVLCYLLMTVLIGNLFLRNPDRERVSWLNKFIGFCICLLPLAMAIAVIFGYYYTVLRLTDRLVGTLYAFLIFTLLEAMLIRGLDVAAKRLAYQRALRKQQEQQTEGLEGETLEEPQIDLQQVNEQSLRLMRLGLWVVLIGVLYWIWSDLLSVMSYLDNISLYELTNTAGLTTPISLRDLLGALLFAAIAFILARNLPGLLEVTLLSRLSLAQGTNYAITTLLSYVLIGAGAVTTLSTLGVTWDRLQWLVAALSVGIGFGMQEIFANFVSGLIILFERQVRIGDSITIGGITGTVKKIRIRATHIIDSDRKEVIVPNKVMVTSQLTNWTLSDTVTRVVLNVSVNRGADLNQVRDLLLKATRDNPRVMRDPAPSVQVTAYSPSSLTHELKVYVRELSDRGLVTDELNRRIDQLLAENGINLSSPQKMDVTLHRSAPQVTEPTPN